MDFELLPIKEIMLVLRAEPDAKTAFKGIIEAANKKMPSKIWEIFDEMSINKDIEDAFIWIKNQVNEHPNSKGIYFGLDTLNMNDGNGTNVEIGLSKSCNPKELSDEWTYDCEEYGKSHLIRGLYLASESYIDDSQWTADERSFAEYVVFLGYSGIVFREALDQLETENDFFSIWGFHDGDTFFLMQKANGLKSMITEMD